MWYLLCFVVAIMLAVGQSLFKASAVSWVAKDNVQFSIFNIISMPFLLSLSVYGLATILWVFILRYVPLSKAYPIMLAGSVCIPVMAYFFFSEPITLRYVIGFSIVLLGLYISVA